MRRRQSIHSFFLFCQAFWTSLSFTPLTISSAGLRRTRFQWGQSIPLASSTQSGIDLSEIASSLDQSFKNCASSIAVTSKVRVEPTRHRLGLVASEPIRKGDVVLSIPLDDDNVVFTARLARDTVFQDVLPVESFEMWTSDAGLIALLILNEVARASNDGTAGTPLLPRNSNLQQFINCWVRALPSPEEMVHHPLLWTEEAQEALQSSSTIKIYQKLDDIEEDARWLQSNVFDADRARFPPIVEWNGRQLNCFNLPGFTWAVALAQSRSLFLDGALRLIPILDMCNHDDGANEVRAAKMGMFGSTKGSQLVAASDVRPGDEVLGSYGPRNAAEYLLEYGFVPDRCWTAATAQLTFELDPNDRFYDDKMDVLECEGLNPTQSFDVVSAPGREGGPDPALLQFLRLSKLGSTDAFLLESIFRNDVWGFMRMPVSEMNELDVVNTILASCESALNDMTISDDDEKDKGGDGPEICDCLRKSETQALRRTVEYLLRDREALDLKEYYQERRLKDLGLDSDWSLEDGMGGDGGGGTGGVGESRTPGMVDYDW